MKKMHYKNTVNYLTNKNCPNCIFQLTAFGNLLEYFDYLDITLCLKNKFTGVKMKPIIAIKFELKQWVVYSSIGGFCFHWDIYKGKSEEQ